MAKSPRLAPQQFESVSALNGPDRYKHFVSRVADWECVWGLRDESGWVSAADDDGEPCFPVWPHQDYASACATGEWEGNNPTAIDIHEFVENWLPDMSDKGVSVAVFPTTTMSGVIISALELQQDIQEELSRIE